MGKFKCSDGSCIPDVWHCDAEDDCGDSSDELGCKGKGGGHFLHLICFSKNAKGSIIMWRLGGCWIRPYFGCGPSLEIVMMIIMTLIMVIMLILTKQNEL